MNFRSYNQIYSTTQLKQKFPVDVKNKFPRVCQNRNEKQECWYIFTSFFLKLLNIPKKENLRKGGNKRKLKLRLNFLWVLFIASRSAG